MNILIETYLIVGVVFAIFWFGNMVYATLDLNDDLLNHHDRVPISKNYFRKSFLGLPIVFVWPLVPLYFLVTGAGRFVTIVKIAFKSDEDKSLTTPSA